MGPKIQIKKQISSKISESTFQLDRIPLYTEQNIHILAG